MGGSGLLSSGMQPVFLWVAFAPAAAVLLPWMAGATFAMNPLGDEGVVLPVTLISVSGSAYIRGLMLPGLLFGMPAVVLVTGGAALVGTFEPSVAFGLLGASLLTTLVAVTTAPAVGLWFPRFSAISVRTEPRGDPTAVADDCAPFPWGDGSRNASSGPRPRTTTRSNAHRRRYGLPPGGTPSVGYGWKSGVLSDVGTWFHGIGTAIQSIRIESFRFTAGGLLVLGAVIVAVASYRLANTGSTATLRGRDRSSSSSLILDSFRLRNDM